MKKIYTFLVVSMAFLSFQSTAQLSIGAGGGLIKSTEDNTESLFGGELNAKYDVSDQLRAGVNFGFYQRSDDVFGAKLTQNLLPISISGEYLFLEDKFRPYVGLHVGAIRVGVKFGNSNSSDTYFSLAPVAGIDYRLSGKIGLNFNFKYGFALYKDDVSDEIENFATFSPNLGVYFKM